MSLIDQPGLYDLSASRYHSDPTIEPSLSASIGHILLAQSPAHARWAHPRLNPAHQDSEPTTMQDEGTALHAAILEQRSVVAVCDFDDWRGKEAQHARKLARETGKVPILRRRWEVIDSVALAARDALRAHEVGDVLATGHAEKVMVWQEKTPAGLIWCRSRVDWLRTTTAPIGFMWDLKTVGGSAEPGAWGKRLASEGLAMQAAFYLRGARALGLQPAGFRYIVVERDPPFGLSVCECSPELMAHAEQMAKAAITEFARHLHANDWPGYPAAVASIEAPPWVLMQWEERSLRAERLSKPKDFYMPSNPRVVQSGIPFA